MNLFNIIDDLQRVDEEIIDRLEHASRRNFLCSLSNLGTKVAAAAVPMAVASIFNKATAQSAMAKEVLEFALTLEYLEAEYYNKGLATPGLIPANRMDMFDQIRDHEVAHVKVLETALGLAPNAKKPNFDFTAKGTLAPFSSYDSFVFLSHAFEDLGVRAYKGQAGKLINDDAILETALRIHSVEARHAAVVRRELSDIRNNPKIKAWITLSEGSPAPVYANEHTTMHIGKDIMGIAGKSKEAISEAFDEPLTKEEVLAIAKPFLA
jgi:hypothetical protein